MKIINKIMCFIKKNFYKFVISPLTFLIKCWITAKSIMVYGAVIKTLMVIFIIMLIFLKNK
ncbi:hypothetical protein DXB93_19060 [Thomasclavelia ramosa]|uniref:Uncharacterized protein n=1 Tax=Thomasclavelia ramosa TaxID=1547 RepID=A0A3E3E3J0_9FIRM|nr:hypothetical protein DXB93_19060 [Thomasclavelia ramosa]